MNAEEIMGTSDGLGGEPLGSTQIALDTGSQAPTFAEELHRMVSQEARQNGWEVLGIDAVTGYRGVIRLYRPNAPSGRHYGTAHFTVNGGAVEFERWNYDLTHRDSRADFSARVAQGR